MPSGLVALFDDVAVIARAAAASLDNTGAVAGKAAGVVIDDAAVTPSYVTEFTPDRELPVIWAIAKGSLKNKLIVLLPAALLLSQFLPWAVTPLLMLGGFYLCFEGAEKVIEKLGGAKHGEVLGDEITDMAEFEAERISGAVRTDFILSAEIMAIALAEVAGEPLLGRALILAVVGIAITALVYGAVALIVKMDDAGLHLAGRRSSGARLLGRALVRAMPVLLAVLASVGTLAMLWVGGGILLHGAHELGWHGPAGLAETARHTVETVSGPLAGVLGWLSHAVIAGLIGLAVGGVIAWLIHRFKIEAGAEA